MTTAAVSVYRAAQRRLAARVNAVHDEAHARADRLADRTAAISARIWREMWAAIIAATSYADRLQLAQAWMRRLTAAMESEIGTGLRGLTRQAHAGQARGLVDSLPTEYLVALAASRQVVLFEDDSAGQVELSPAGLRTARPASATREDWQELLFPAPSQSRVEQIVMSPAGSDGLVWTDRLKRLSKLVDADAAATAIAIGLSQGKSTHEVAKALVPAVQGYRSSAMRIARTEGLRVAHVSQMECHEQLGDLNAGYYIRATIDFVTRPKHAARNGRQWFKDSGQDMAQTLAMSQDTLPDEPNCRCRLLPILRPPANVPAEAAEILASTKLPEVKTAAKWWDNATVAERRTSVGAKRYVAAAETLGRSPRFADFIDPTTADLVSPEQIRAEGKTGVLERRAAVNVVQRQQAADIAQVRRWGFSPKAEPVGTPNLFPAPAAAAPPVVARPVLTTPPITPAADPFLAAMTRAQDRAATPEDLALLRGTSENPMTPKPQAAAAAAAIRAGGYASQAADFFAAARDYAPPVRTAADLSGLRPGTIITIAGERAVFESARRAVNVVVVSVRTMDGRPLRYRMPAGATAKRAGPRAG